VLLGGYVFRVKKRTHLRQEMAAALNARTWRVCITLQATLPYVFFLFLIFLHRPPFAFSPYAAGARPCVLQSRPPVSSLLLALKTLKASKSCI
jgi:hypothetical protein